MNRWWHFGHEIASHSITHRNNLTYWQVLYIAIYMIIMMVMMVIVMTIIIAVNDWGWMGEGDRGSEENHEPVCQDSRLWHLRWISRSIVMIMMNQGWGLRSYSWAATPSSRCCTTTTLNMIALGQQGLITILRGPIFSTQCFHDLALRVNSIMS